MGETEAPCSLINTTCKHIRANQTVQNRLISGRALFVLMHDPDTLITPSSDEVLERLRDLVSPSHLQHDAAALHIRAMALLGRLKSLHRASNTATRLAKEKTAEARQEMDQSHLNLQNLLYEKRHLEREIEKCRQFA